jgi:hypothetical protein
MQAEIYRYVDDQGRVQFSDNPNSNYNVQAISSGVSTSRNEVDVEALESKAQQLKQNRLEREKHANKLIQKKRKARLKYQKALAKKKKKEEACELARIKENLAFRNRSKSRNLTAMRKALEQYEKKRKMRIKKCR